MGCFMFCNIAFAMLVDMKTLKKENCVVFRKTHETFGGFSNMCGGYRIKNGLFEFQTSEHLYQVCKFTEHPDIQNELLSEKNPMIMKNKTKKYNRLVRKDWEEIKVDVMKWVLKGKFVCNFIKFGNLLIESGNKEIVEISKKDDFWGMKENGEEYVGNNFLGKKLMNIRDLIWLNSNELKEWEVDDSLKIKIYGKSIENLSVDKKVFELGMRSFNFLIKKHGVDKSIEFLNVNSILLGDYGTEITQNPLEVNN